MEASEVHLKVVNLGLHLLVSTSAFDVVAVCLHPLGIREAEPSHLLLERDAVPYAAPDTAVKLPDIDVKEFRRLSYAAAKAKGCKSQRALALQMGVTERTLRNWKRKGVV